MPSRTGPRALAVHRREANALALRAEGWNYEAIARTLGYAGRSGAYKAVSRALRRLGAEDAAALRQLEGMRLDALQAALWERALAGDLDAVDRVLRIIHRRITLFGLEVTPGASPAAPVHLAIRFTGDEEPDEAAGERRSLGDPRRPVAGIEI